MPAKMPAIAQINAEKRLHEKNRLEVKRAIRRIEFCLEYVITGIYERKCLRSGKPNRRKKTSKSDAFISSPDWKRLRQVVINHYGAVCMRCGSTETITVDHIKPKSKHPELAMVFDNMQVLCWRCNKNKNTRHETDYRSRVAG